MTACIISIRPQPDADLDVAALARRKCACAGPSVDGTYLSCVSRRSGCNQICRCHLYVPARGGRVCRRRGGISMAGSAGLLCWQSHSAAGAAQAGFTRTITGHGGGRACAADPR